MNTALSGAPIMRAAAIVAALDGKPSARGGMAKCPAHEDGSPSLSITERDGKILVHCFSGCCQADIIAALRERGLWPEKKQPTWTPKERADWGRQQRELERKLPTARLWRRAAVDLADELLDSLKAALFDPSLPWPEPGDIYCLERWLSKLKRIDGSDLLEEFGWWKAHYPEMTTALLREGQILEQAEERALRAFLLMTEGQL